MAHILLTGITGFIARRIADDLLALGHNVRGSVRDPGAEAELRALWPEAGPRLDIVTLDLTRDEGWAEAARGMDAILHTASPFPMVQNPKDPSSVIDPARDGTRRALGAAGAAGVSRVVLTSSSVAIMNGPRPEGRLRDERDWSSLDHPNSRSNAYVRSKIEAERLAWELAEELSLDLTSLNPGFVLGPPLGAERNTSLGIVERVLSGKDTLLPPLKYEAVDVRDVARAHIAALERPETAGERYALVSGGIWMADIARLAREIAPHLRIAKRVAPAALIKGMALMDPTLKTLVPILGRDEPLPGDKARAALGLAYVPAEDAVRASIEALL